MKHKHVFWILLIPIMLAFTVFVDTAPARQNEKSNAIPQLLTKIMKTQSAAWNKGDIDGFMQAYWKSEKLSFSAGGQTTRGWVATRDRYKKKYATKEKMGQLTFSDLEITLLSKDAALVLGRWKLVRKADAPSGNFSLVFRKLGDEWVIIHDHSSSLEE